MGVYNVGKVDTITDGRDSFYGFNVIGVHDIGVMTIT
jgi:hypothetical protein